MERNVICNWDTSFEELDFKVEILLKIRCAIYVFHFVYFSYYIQTLFQKGAFHTLFRKKRFLVNLKTERNASKFAMFMEKENPRSFFRFSFRATFIFPLMNALLYVDIDQGIHKGKMKVALNEKGKKLHGFSFSINIIF